MNESILIVDDEKEIADLIEVYLKNDDYTVHKFYNGLDALECIETQKMDLAILDVMLPDIDGFRICQKIRVLPQLSVIIVISHVPQLCFKQLLATPSIHCTFYHF